MTKAEQAGEVPERTQAFGTVLRRHRQARGLTQEELAEQAQLSRRSITDLERGVAQPRKDTLALLATALGLTGTERTLFLAARRRPALPASGAPPETTAPLVGRAQELALLDRHLTAEGPPLLLLAGEPGIGKTRLLHAAATRARGQGLRVLESGCQRGGGTVPFGAPYAPLLGALERHLRQATADEARRDLRGCAWLVRLLPELADGPIEPLPAWTVPPEQERRLMFAAVERFLTNVGGAVGTVLLLDDVHWAGPDALDLLATLVRSATTAPPGSAVPLRIVGAYRDAEVAPHDALAVVLADLAQAGLAAHRTVGPLRPEEGAHLLATLLPGDAEVAADLQARVLQRSGGVPFFIVSYAHAVTRRDSPTGGAEAVPWTVAHGVRQRVAALSVPAQEILAVAALLGRAIHSVTLTAVVAHPERDVLQALEEACRARLLVEQRESYQFAHDVIREVIDADVGAARRLVIHRRIAEALEQQPGATPVEVLAYHLRQSDAPDRAILYLVQAGERARGQYAYAAAERYYREALDLCDGAHGNSEPALPGATVGSAVEAPHQTQRLTALRGLGEVLRLQEKLEDAEAYLRRAVALGHELRQPARVVVQLYGALGDVLYHQGRGAEQVQIGEAGLALLGDDAASVEAAIMHATLTSGHELQGQHDQAHRHLLRTADLMRTLPYSRHWSTFLWSVNALLGRKDIQKAREVVQLAEARAHQHSTDLALALMVQVQQGNICSIIGDFRGAVAHLQAALDGHAGCDPIMQRLIWGWCAEFSLILGDLPRAADAAEKVRTALSEKVPRALPDDAPGGRAENARHLAVLALCAGDADAARTHLEAVVPAERNAGGASPHPESLVCLGRVLLAQGQRLEAVHQFVQAVVAVSTGTAGQGSGVAHRVLPNAMSGVEDACGSVDSVRAVVEHLGRAHPALQGVPCVTCLEPAAVTPLLWQTVREAFAAPLCSLWAWQDPLGDSSFALHDGLHIGAANGRDLWHVNLSAPRLLRPAPDGAFVMQTCCVPASDDRPGIGGLLLWQDTENYLVLERGHWGVGDISFRGCLANEDRLLGRGWLVGEQVWLRLERQGGIVRAVCSIDGVAWFGAGEITFPAREGEQVGLHAIGMIDRTIYHGAFPAGTAICFTSFDVATVDVS